MSAALGPQRVFAAVIGLADGILTALTLAAGRIVSSPEPIAIGLAVRISAASSLSGIFVFFTAEYVRQRRDLVHAERQLNLTSRGHLATTRLGEVVFRDTMRAAALSSICNLLGALLPLSAGALWPQFSWLAIAAAILVLGVLGATAARITYANPFVWAATLMLAGGLLTIAGIKLRIV
jgi:predicted membrane protein (TIGR00267 family)